MLRYDGLTVFGVEGLMGWLESHILSERLAAAADRARSQGLMDEARRLYVEAARNEERALAELSALERPLTFAVTAVHAAALSFKGQDFERTRQIALEVLQLTLLRQHPQKYPIP